MARRTFGDLKTALITRVGRAGDTAFATRAEELIKAAYFDLATKYFHHELVLSPLADLASAAVTVALPADTYVVIQAILASAASGNAAIQPLAFVEARYAIASAAPPKSAGRPSAYTRFGAELLTDRPADAAYKVRVYYQKLPAEPSFSSGSSLIGIQWDEPLLNLACAWGLEALWRPDLAATKQALVDKFLSENPQVLLRDLPIHGIQQTQTRGGTPLGGPQG